MSLKPTIFSRHKLTISIATGATVIVLASGASVIAESGSSSSSANATAATSASSASGRPVSARAGSNARSGPAAGGSSGTVDRVSSSSFTMSTSGGQQVTVNTPSSTTYKKGRSASSASAVTKGESVLALGTTRGTTITASQVVVQPTGGGGAASSSAAGVVPFRRGAPSTSKHVGEIPVNYRQGSGTIVSGKEANKATEAALAAYPGGVVDRAVKLSNGEYEVHNIGVNWPHHVFVSQTFKVLGAN